MPNSSILTLCFVIFVLSACSGGSSSSSGDAEEVLNPFPTGALELDFTFPVKSVVPDITNLNGVAIVRQAGLIVLVDDFPALHYISLEGELDRSIPLSLSGEVADISSGVADQILIGTPDGTTWSFDSATESLNSSGQLFEPLLGLAVSAAGTFATIEENGEPQFIGIEGDNIAEIPTDNRLGLYSIQAMDAFEASLFVLARDESNAPFLFEFSEEGAFLEGWALSGNLTGIAVLERSDDGVSVFASDSNNGEPLLLSFEPPPVGGQLDAPSLDLVGEFEVGMGGAEQPSGLTIFEQELYYITDFGVVAKSALDGSNLQVLFEIDDALQGSFESIAVRGGEISVLASDDSGLEPTVVVFDPTGIRLREFQLPRTDSVIEGFQFDGEDILFVNADEGEDKVITRLMSDGTFQDFVMGPAYTDLTFAGIAVDEDQLIIVTDQRESDEGEVLSGLVIVWDLVESVERARFAVANGEGVGVIDPSGIAIDLANDTLYVASDTDAGEIFAYDFDED